MATLSIGFIINSSTVGTLTITTFPTDLYLTGLFGPFHNDDDAGAATITQSPMLYPEAVTGTWEVYAVVVDAGELFLAPNYLGASVTVHLSSLSFDWTAPAVQTVINISSPRTLVWNPARVVGGIVGDDDLTFGGNV